MQNNIMNCELIDFHTHNFPEELAPRAIDVMVKKLRGCLMPVGDGTLVTQLSDMKKSGVSHSVVCPIATKPSQFQVILERAKAVRDGVYGDEAAKCLVQLCSVHPDDQNYELHFKEIAAQGFKGIKIHPYYQGFSLADPKVVSFFSAARDSGLFVISHCGFDLGFTDVPMICGPDQISTLLRAVPDLVFIAGHLGGCGGNQPHATDKLLDFPNCYIDTAVISVCDDDPESQRIMSEWPAERIVFGTDYFWRDAAFLAEWVRRYRSNSSDQQKIFSDNAKFLLGL
jgi:predicted TIM-barrel fold metal-dependent hydrolase